MSIHVVSYLNFMDNGLISVVVQDDTATLTDVEALNEGLRVLGKVYEGETGFENCATLDDAKDLAFDGDLAINVIKVA